MTYRISLKTEIQPNKYRYKGHLEIRGILLFLISGNPGQSGESGPSNVVVRLSGRSLLAEIGRYRAAPSRRVDMTFRIARIAGFTPHTGFPKEHPFCCHPGV